MEKIAAIASLSALAHASRLDVYRLLVQAGHDGIAAGALGESLGLPAPTLSFHLNHLKQAGLVEVRRQGRSLIYSADYDRMNGLVAYLTENCCQGAADACVSPVCVPAPPRTHKIGVNRNEALPRTRRR